MPIRNINNYLESGEASSIKLGGVADENSVVIKADIAKVVTTSAYCFYKSEPDLALTNDFQVIKNFETIITPLRISYDNATGNFIAIDSGIYEWDFERVYANYDKAPTSPVQLELQVVLNDTTVVYTRTGILGAATGNNEPNMYSATSPFIYEVQANSRFKFQVRGIEGVPAPSNTRLTLAQIKANKIYNL